MKTNEAIKFLEKQIKNQREGLPYEIFLFASRTVPMINVDLLIKNDEGQTLLTWRHDEHYGPGWHIPGGIIRFKEKMAKRIAAVAKKELGATVDFEENPIAVKEFIEPAKKNRGHFISLLFQCKLTSPLNESIEYKNGVPKVGQWSWRNNDENLIEEHKKVYKKYL